MLYPGLPVIILAVTVLALLMTSNWLVWGLTSARNGRRPKLVGPIDGRNRLNPDNLPDDGGFKRVA
jgi:hypothetical protein